MSDIGVDYGKRRIGLAMVIDGVVLPLEPLLDGTWSELAEHLASLQSGHGPGRIVVGLPVSASGRSTELSDEVEKLAEFLAQKGFEVELQREVGTTAEAARLRGRSDRNGRVDSVSAAVILKRFLGIP